MVKVFGNDILNAFTGGNPVKEIYSYGEKVWPVGRLPKEYKEVNWISGNNTGTETSPHVPTFLLDIPFISGGFVIEATVNNSGASSTSDSDGVFNVHYYDTYRNDTLANRAAFYDWSFKDGFCRSNYGIRVSSGVHEIKQTFPINCYNTKTYIDGSEYTGFDNDYPKNSLKNPSRVAIGVLSNPWFNFDHEITCLQNGRNMIKIYNLKIKDSNDNLLYDFVPAIRLEDGHVSLFDLVNNEFHERNNLNGVNFTFG